MLIDGPFRKEIRLALLEAFPLLSELKLVVEETIGEPLQNITMANDMPTVAFDLIGWAKARGRLAELIIGASAERPKAPKLRGVADRFNLVDTTPGEEERIVVQGVPFENAGVWLDQFARLRRAVCRFEPQPQIETIEGFGSAFLVGPDVIMTNHHVISRPFPPLASNGLMSDAEAAKAVIRFDYEVDLSGNVQSGREVKLAAAGWCLAENKALDYALLRLAQRASDISAPSGAARPYIKLSPHNFVIGEPVVVVQHPMAKPLKLAFGTVVIPTDGDGVTYNANTEGGSSGSPCMTTALETVALHHQGKTSTNRAVRMSKILDHLRVTGNDRFLAEA